ncbi:MAG: type II secretion system protein GspD [Pirellulales bacterium]
MTRMLPNAWALAIRGSLMYLTAFSFFAVQADSRESHAQVISPTSNAPTPIIQEETSVTPVFDPANLEPLIDTEDPLLMSFSDRLVMPDTTIEMVDFRDQDLGAAMRLFSEQSGINIVPSTDANKVKVNLFLRDVKAMDVLENLTKTHDLYYRIDEKSGVIRIHTTEEYEENLASFRDEQTKVFTLLYPNPVDAAVAIRDLFGDRVVLNFGVGDQDSVLDLVHRLNRFDLVDSRNLGLGSFQGQTYGGRSFNSLNGMGGFSTNPAYRNSRNRAIDETEPLSNLSSDDIQQLIDTINDRSTRAEIPANLEDPISKLLKERQATIYVTVVRRNNQVVVRTGDEATMDQIATLIQSLDVPTPLVLLELKVMRILLDDEFRSVFDYQYSDGSTTAGSFTTGDILPTPSDKFSGNARKFASMIPDGSVLNKGDFTFQVVSNNFRARMQLLEDDNRVTILNSPLLLTANNEVSRIFIGETIPLTIGFSPTQIVGTSATSSNTIAGTPITELRDIGQSLLITPSINADRTVTLRVVQENAQRVIDGGKIPVLGLGNSTQEFVVDTVTRSTVSGTFVAKDGLAVVMGGLIEDEISDQRQKIPGLGKLPVLGFFFRRQNTSRIRRELVVMIRPYVFNTPTESAAISQDLLQQLSVHPSALSGEPTLSTFLPSDVLQTELDDCELHKFFKFHNIVPKAY